MGFVPAGAFAVAGLAAVAGTRWALIVPGAVIVACGAIILAARPGFHPGGGPGAQPGTQPGFRPAAQPAANSSPGPAA
jgi:hypothetical protein